MTQETRYPLTWPRGVKRTPPSAQIQQHTWERADFNKVLWRLDRELTLLGAADYILSTNQPVRNDGLPYAQERRISDAGVALWFTLNGKKICLPCDKWVTIKQNTRAIAMHIEAIRGQERWGVGTTEQAFAGYAALPATAGEGRPWRQVLEITENKVTVDVIEIHYRRLAKEFHPDVPGGDATKMAQLNRAREEALAELKQ